MLILRYALIVIDRFGEASLEYLGATVLLIEVQRKISNC